MNKKELRQVVGAIKSAKTWENACTRLGFQVDKFSGKGSHCCVWLPDCEIGIDIRNRVIIIIKKMYKQANIKMFDAIIKKTSVSEKELLEALKII